MNDYEIETELVRTLASPEMVLVRLYRVTTERSITGSKVTTTETRDLVDAWTCRVGGGDSHERTAG